MLGSIRSTKSPEKEPVMKLRASWIVVLGMLMAAEVAAAQQAAAPAASAPRSRAAAPDMSPVANPVSGVLKAGVARYGKNMVAAAEARPGEKYRFKPSPGMDAFGSTWRDI